jgi:preprotein translocase subunit SecF
MIEIFHTPSYNFIGRRKIAYAVSLLAMILGLGSLATKGLRYDIDFTGGTLVQVRFEQPPDIGKIRSGLGKAGIGDAIIQQFGDPREYIIRLPLSAASSQDVAKKIEQGLGSEPSLGKSEIRRVEFVGPQVGKELQLQAVYAVLFGLVGILIYLAVRFDLKGGVAAVLAVFHDVVICMGSMSVFGREFSLPVLAALLTIIGFSVNDTIVAYDRLRENRGRGGQRGKTFADQMNDAINQTLSRTILTSLTVFISTAILLFLGGKVLEDFAFVLFIGVITGTYSTIYVASALVVDWTIHVEGRKHRKKAVARA